MSGHGHGFGFREKRVAGVRAAADLHAQSAAGGGLPTGIATPHGGGQTVPLQAVEDDARPQSALVGEPDQALVEGAVAPEAVAFHEHTHQDAGLCAGRGVSDMFDAGRRAQFCKGLPTPPNPRGLR